MPFLQSIGSNKGLGFSLWGKVLLSYVSTAFVRGSNSSTLPATTINGYGAKTFSYTGTLPDFVTFNSSTGTFTGPNAASWNWSPIANTNTGVVFPKDCITQADGSTIFVGHFTTGPVTFGSTTLSLGTYQTGFAAKLSNTGSWVWAVTLGGNGNTSVTAVDKTSDGVMISGFYSTAGITIGSTTLSLNGTGNGFVARLVDNGSSASWSWATATVNTGGNGNLQAIAVDSSNNAYVTGTFGNANATFGSTTLTKTGSINTAIAKINSTGSWVWALGNTGTGVTFGTDVAVLSSGDVVFVGRYQVAATTFGATTLSITGNTPGFIAKVTAAGSWAWATSCTSSSIAGLYAVCATSDGGAVVGGGMNATATFGSITCTKVSTGTQATTLAKISTSGVWQWASTNSGAGDITIGTQRQITENSNQDIVFTSFFQTNSVTFGSSTITMGSGTATGCVVKSNSSGAWQWALAIGGVRSNGWGISNGSNGGVVVGINFSPGTITLGATNVSGTPTWTGCIAKVSNSGTWVSSAQGFPAALTVSVTDASGTTQTPITLTAV